MALAFKEQLAALRAIVTQPFGADVPQPVAEPGRRIGALLAGEAEEDLAIGAATAQALMLAARTAPSAGRQVDVRYPRHRTPLRSRPANSLP